MKSTFELPDELMITAKKHAAELRMPVRELVEAGLRAQLRQAKSQPIRVKSRRIRWVTVEGAPPEELDPSNRESLHATTGRALGEER